MTRISLLIVGAALLLTACAPAHSRTYYGFQVGVTNAPPPPRIVFYEAPQYVVVPGTSVYVVDNYNYDLFVYGSYTYLYSGGFWYRSRAYRGPYVAVDVRQVPSRVVQVPSRHWKHHPHGGPPGHGKKRGGWNS